MFFVSSHLCHAYDNDSFTTITFRFVFQIIYKLCIVASHRHWAHACKREQNTETPTHSYALSWYNIGLSITVSTHHPLCPRPKPMAKPLKSLHVLFVSVCLKAQAEMLLCEDSNVEIKNMVMFYIQTHLCTYTMKRMITKHDEFSTLNELHHPVFCLSHYLTLSQDRFGEMECEIKFRIDNRMQLIWTTQRHVHCSHVHTKYFSQSILGLIVMSYLNQSLSNKICKALPKLKYRARQVLRQIVIVALYQ